MQADNYKCCFCLLTVIHPVVMCHQTHIGCFDCMCSQLRINPKAECAVCRQKISLRFDRLITATSNCLRRAKRKKTTCVQHDVFVKLLKLKEKDRFRPFTKTMGRFALAVATGDKLEQISEDIDNIILARESVARLLNHKLYDHRLERKMSAHI
jgi:hypothetical protein